MTETNDPPGPVEFAALVALADPSGPKGSLIPPPTRDGMPGRLYDKPEEALWARDELARILAIALVLVVGGVAVIHALVS